MPITFAVNIVKVPIAPQTLQAFCLGYTYSNISEYLSYGIQTWHDGRQMHGICILYAHACVDDLDLDVRSVAWQRTISGEVYRQVGLCEQ